LLTHLSAQSSTADAVSAKQVGQWAGVLAALVTGDQAAINRSDWDVFRATGVAHLMSISGLHVTMFAWLASALVAWCWRKSALWGFAGALRWPAVHVGSVSGLVLAWFYALFSGWGVPAQRTLWMLLVVVFLKISARQWHGALVWLLAGAVVLALDPWALLQAGFWLSFVAVGVLMASLWRTDLVLKE
jgi:competence protein ComEC